MEASEFRRAVSGARSIASSCDLPADDANGRQLGTEWLSQLRATLARPGLGTAG